MKMVELSPTAILYLPAIETWLGKGWEHSENIEGPSDALGFSPYLEFWWSLKTYINEDHNRNRYAEYAQMWQALLFFLTQTSVVNKFSLAV